MFSVGRWEGYCISDNSSVMVCDSLQRFPHIRAPPLLCFDNVDEEFLRLGVLLELFVAIRHSNSIAPVKPKEQSSPKASQGVDMAILTRPEFMKRLRPEAFHKVRVHGHATFAVVTITAAQTEPRALISRHWMLPNAPFLLITASNFGGCPDGCCR